MAIHIGTSGWSYDHWDGVLYPHGTTPAERLAHYVRRFRTVEVNSTFYRWPPATTFTNWHRRLPDGFLMTAKAPRGLTHGRRLYAPEEWLERMTPGLRSLGEKRGALLVQVPPAMECDLARLQYFLARWSHRGSGWPWNCGTRAGSVRRSSACWNGTGRRTA